MLYNVVVKLHLSKTSGKILKLFFYNGNKSLYVNEIVRETNSFPNSVQRSLKTLEEQDLIVSERKGNKKFYSLNKEYANLSEIKALATGNSKKGEQDRQTWIKLVNRDVSVATNSAIMKAQREAKYMGEFRIKTWDFHWYNSVTGGVYYTLEEIKETGKLLAKEVKKDTKFSVSLVDNCMSDGEKLIEKTKNVVKKNLPNLSDTKLRKMLEDLVEDFMQFLPYLVIPHSIERIIESELDEVVFDLETKERLMEPTDVLSEEQIDELHLAALVKKDGWSKENERKLVQLTEKYCWLPIFNLHTKPFDLDHFRKLIDDLKSRIPNPSKEVEKLQKQEGERKKSLQKTLDEINADQKLRNLVNTAQAYIKLRTYRINILRRFNFHHLPLLNEIATRIGVAEEEIGLLTYEEILEALEKKGSRKVLSRLTKKRKEGYAMLTWNGKTKVIAGIERIIHTMEQYNILAGTPSAKREVRGNPACKGLATGSVKIVKKLSELHKVQKGDILVAKMTTPDYMIAINKAAAIVTDEGGITCHAAIVSREFNIPCVVGTRNATQILADGDVVEVDANEGVIRVIESTDFPEDLKELHGKTIYKGKVKGTARIILDASDFDKLVEGDIIIAPQTTPEYLSLLYRAKGFVVDEESITSHAVLYGKALKLPSIMGTSFARNAIEDGEEIELDATNGVVRKLSH